MKEKDSFKDKEYDKDNDLDQDKRKSIIIKTIIDSTEEEMIKVIGNRY